MTKLLSLEQVDQYHNSGFVSPINILNHDEITKSLNEIESFEKETGRPIDFPHKSRSHQLFSWADYLITFEYVMLKGVNDSDADAVR